MISAFRVYKEEPLSFNDERIVQVVGRIVSAVFYQVL
jgi:hypothetical protein